jgi:signal transduction histidine kinase
MVNLTSQLLAYARGGRYQAKTMSLRDFVEDTIPIIKPNIDPSIRLETDLPRDVFSVKADPIQMQMVLSAVVSNSTEAIEGNGRIRITVSNKEIDSEFAKNHPELNPGNHVCLTVEDDGKGMDAETLNKIFDPFYTTKFMGRGLGMAAVYGIIRNHDGWITVDSELNKGTIIRIYLPGIEV